MSAPSVHLVAVDLDLMRSDDRDEVVGAQDLLDGLEAEFDGALTLWIGTEFKFARVAIVHRI